MTPEAEVKTEADIAASTIVLNANVSLPIESHDLLITLVAMGWLVGWKAGAERIRDISLGVMEEAGR